MRATLLLASVWTATAAPSLPSRIRGAYFGAVVADALTLGTHYEYDAERIKKFYGGIDRTVPTCILPNPHYGFLHLFPPRYPPPPLPVSCNRSPKP